MSIQKKKKKKEKKEQTDNSIITFGIWSASLKSHKLSTLNDLPVLILGIKAA